MSLQEYIIDLGFFLNFTIIPFLFTLALLFFVVNVVRYFVIGSNDQEKREHARRLALYGIAGFVLLVSIWGIVNIITSGLGIDYDTSFCPDYMGNWCLDTGTNYRDSSYFYFEFGAQDNPYVELPDEGPIPPERPNNNFPNGSGNF